VPVIESASEKSGITESRTKQRQDSSFAASNFYSVNRTLRAAGWRVLRVWECDLTVKNVPRVLRRIRRALNFQ